MKKRVVQARSRVPATRVRAAPDSTESLLGWESSIGILGGELPILAAEYGDIEKRLGTIEAKLGIKNDDWFPQEATTRMEWMRKEDASNPDRLSIGIMGDQLLPLMILLDQAGKKEEYFKFAATLNFLKPELIQGKASEKQPNLAPFESDLKR